MAQAIRGTVRSSSRIVRWTGRLAPHAAFVVLATPSRFSACLRSLTAAIAAVQNDNKSEACSASRPILREVAKSLLRARRIARSGGRSRNSRRRRIGLGRRAMGRGGSGLGTRRIRARCHRAFGIQQVILAWSQAQLDERPRVGNGLALPAMVGLITAHGLFAGLVPCAGRGPSQIVLANQRLLNFLGSFRVDLLLAFRPPRLFLVRRMFSRRLLARRFA